MKHLFEENRHIRQDRFSRRLGGLKWSPKCGTLASMLDEKFLKLLACPETRTMLANAESALVNRLNGAIAKRTLVNCGGKTLQTPLEGALVRADGAVAYPIIDQIPQLLVEEGIPLAQLSSTV